MPRSDDWFDEEAPQGSPADLLAARLEAASDAYATAANKAAIAENQYLRARQIAYAKASADAVAVTARREVAEHDYDTVEARCEFNMAVAFEKNCRTKYDEVRQRLIHALSHEKMIREQT